MRSRKVQTCTRPPASRSCSCRLIDDRALREAVLERLQGASWFSLVSPNVVVTDGVVTLWGRVLSEKQRKAVHLLIETTPGVKGLDDHLADNESMYNHGYI